MFVYRITLAGHANQLYAPGVAGRWNRAGTYVIYASFARSLACLENIVHRSSTELGLKFRCMVIEIPDEIEQEIADTRIIPGEWFGADAYHKCQGIGDSWLKQSRSCVLKVPSAVVPKEFNYVINVKHPDFRLIRLAGNEEFLFDNRLAENRKP
jgi:RES domain-containing protein